MRVSHRIRHPKEMEPRQGRRNPKACEPFQRPCRGAIHWASEPGADAPRLVSSFWLLGGLTCQSSDPMRTTGQSPRSAGPQRVRPPARQARRHRGRCHRTLVEIRWHRRQGPRHRPLRPQRPRRHRLQEARHHQGSRHRSREVILRVIAVSQTARPKKAGRFCGVTSLLWWTMKRGQMVVVDGQGLPVGGTLSWHHPQK